MNPTNLLKYWSTRPLNKNEFFNMILRDYEFKHRHTPATRQLRLLKDFLYQSHGQLPAIREFSADDDSGIPGQIEFLIYFSPNAPLPTPFSASNIDISYNPILEEEVDDILDTGEYTGISSYAGGSDFFGVAGIEIEFERFIVKVFEDEDRENTTHYSLREFLQDSQIQYDAAIYGHTYDKESRYIQLEYTGLKDYPILNHPGGIR